MTWRFAVALLAALSLVRPCAAQLPADVLAALESEKARAILRNRCGECHTGPAARGGWQVLDLDKLAPLIVKGRPDAAELVQLIECGSEPRGTVPKVPAGEVKVLRNWIAGQAPPFAAESSDDYALRQILIDVLAATGDPAQRDLAREHYFTFNHLLGTAGADPALYAEALTRTLNLLSWEKKFVRPTPIDPTGTIFRVNIDQLGWGTTPYAGSSLNLFDLILLENPHAVVPRSSPVYDELEREYLAKLQKDTKPVRPVVFLRGDWFVNAAGQTPLYEDLLRLPATLPELEKKLRLEDAAFARAGLLKSGEVDVPRILERRSAGDQVLWRTYDLRSVTGPQKLVEAADKPVAVGEVLFSLPNRLPGFYIAGPDGHRYPDVAGDLLKGAAMRNGLACARCHRDGLATTFTDAVRPNLEASTLPEDKKTHLRQVYRDSLAKDAVADNLRFTTALAQLFGKVPERDALGEVDRQYREYTARHPRGADETWLPPLDGLTLPERRRQPEALKVDMAMISAKTMAKAFVFEPDERMYLFVRNIDTKDLWIELVAQGRGGEMGGLMVKDNPPLRLEPGNTYRYPPDPDGKGTMSAGKLAGKNSFILYVSDKKFAAGTLMSPVPRDLVDYVADRFIHAYPKTPAAEADYARIEKRTVTIETRPKYGAR